MSNKLYSVIAFVLLTVLAGSAFAGDLVWTYAGGDGNGSWTNPANWAPTGVPSLATGDKAKVVKLAPNDAHINAGMAAECTWLVVGDNVSGEIHMTGGTLNVSGAGDSWTIIAYGPLDTGIFTMDGGTVTTNNRFYVGFQGTGIVNMNGGTMNIGGTFGIGYGEGFTTGRGYVYLNGGTINVTSTSGTNLNMSSPTGSLGKLDITGGTLNLTGDRRTLVTDYVNNGYITAYNGLGDVIITYGTNTTVTAVTNVTKARRPRPANNASDVAPYTLLSWTPGDTTAEHDIYFGTDANSVRDADMSNPLGVYQTTQLRDVNTFDPGNLELNKVYYWRVDEVNEPNLYKGNLWKFTTADYALVDDFESYADTTGMLGFWSNGSTGAALSLATAGGHDKAKTMVFDYNNSDSPLYRSEAQTVDLDFDGTIAGVKALELWYKGDANNVAEPMYAAVEDNSDNLAIVVNGDPNAAKATEWQVWRIELTDFAGINPTSIKKFYIGFGSRTAPVSGGSGTVYIDDIRLYPTRCLNKPAQDLNDDCVIDFEDFAILAGNWMQESQI